MVTIMITDNYLFGGVAMTAAAPDLQVRLRQGGPAPHPPDPSLSSWTLSRFHAAAWRRAAGVGSSARPALTHIGRTSSPAPRNRLRTRQHPGRPARTSVTTTFCHSRLERMKRRKTSPQRGLAPPVTSAAHRPSHHTARPTRMRLRRTASGRSRSVATVSEPALRYSSGAPPAARKKRKSCASSWQSRQNAVKSFAVVRWAGG